MAFIVFAGQSNTGGAFMNASTLPASWAPDPLTLIWNDAKSAWEQMAPGANTGFGQMPDAWGPEVHFAIQFRAEHPDEVLRIVKSAWGGSPLDQDNGAWKYDWSPRSRDEIFDATTQMIRRASSAADGALPEAVFWGQGETDAETPASAAAYRANLPELFAAVRAEWLHDADGHIGFYRINSSAAHGPDVRYAQSEVDQADGAADSIDARAYPLLGDGLHFSAEGYRLSGEDYFRLFEGWRAGGGSNDPGAGRVINSSGPGDALIGGAGADTLNASQGSDVLTGGGGADVFAWAAQPWSPARVTDFTAGEDRLDLSDLLKAAGYSGADPVADGWVFLFDDGAGGQKVLVDPDGPGGAWANFVVQLEKTGDLTWADLQGQGAEPPPSAGVRVDSEGPGDTLEGGAGADTLVASRGSDVLAGGAGADRFVWTAEPWSPAEVKDFTPGEDRLDLSALGLAGDPLADGRIVLLADGAGGAKVLLDPDGAGGGWGNYVIHLQGVAPERLSVADWIFS
ncbi:sialate O-acetylesterase [Phenylobacterium sp. VNQ135]|uniref:sialate O-acetylesterase n=1 Tax=Phenylobacterium sp. VNQ135 TaxID=3400922 RepID=UPI003C0B13FF